MPRSPRQRTRVTVAALSVLAAFGLGGCALAAIIGGAAESYHQTGSTTYPADYDGLTGKSFAVYVTTDRIIQAEHPDLIARIAGLVNGMLAENVGGTAYIPTQTMLNQQFNNPEWMLMPRGELAETLGVERLVAIEIIDYRLTDAGNGYIWNGLAEGRVEVYEADSAIPDEPSYDRVLAVRFPDVDGVLREEVPESMVTSELSRRLGDRLAWLFFEHEEPNAITY